MQGTQTDAPVLAHPEMTTNTYLKTHMHELTLARTHAHSDVSAASDQGLTQLEARHSISGTCSGRKNARNSSSSINPEPSVSTILTMETRSSSEMAVALMFARRTARRNSAKDNEPLPLVSDTLKSRFHSSSSSFLVACGRKGWVWEGHRV